MPQHKTPGVYVEEVSTLPPSAAEVSTAIPAFIGCTEKGGPSGGGLASTQHPATVARVSTLLEYEQLFGGPPQSAFEVHVAVLNPDSPFRFQIESVARTGPISGFDSILYYCVSHYFKNGGGSCYIVSIGDFSGQPDGPALQAGLDALKKEDEPTLVIACETGALDGSHCATQGAAVLAHCATMGDRFALLDVPEGPGQVDDFRQTLGTSNLSYGAAYYPSLQTTLPYPYDDQNVQVAFDAAMPGFTAPVAPARGRGAKGKKAVEEAEQREVLGQHTLEEVGQQFTSLYSEIKTALAKQYITLPPSAAVAGIYASTDRQRGVWKAPANVSLAAVLGPTVKIDNAEQEGLNVDPTSGKSINAIRAFTGKGTLVWGARTLAGNSNEWRYVPVRRLFIMLEESCQKATAFAVFEPNDLSTWLKVKGMIESLLYDLWEQGAFAGSKPEDAYYVHVGLGTTMTQDDILNRRMIVEIGVAAVRPAEIIVLRFSHKLQES